MNSRFCPLAFEYNNLERTRTSLNSGDESSSVTYQSQPDERVLDHREGHYLV